MRLKLQNAWIVWQHGIGLQWPFWNGHVRQGLSVPARVHQGTGRAVRQVWGSFPKEAFE